MHTRGAGQPSAGASLRSIDPAPVDAEPGSVSRAADGTLRIATGDGWLVPVRLKRAGSKVLAVDDFLRGRPIPDGATLG